MHTYSPILASDELVYRGPTIITRANTALLRKENRVNIGGPLIGIPGMRGH